MDQKQRKIAAEWTEGSSNYDRIIHDEMNSFRPEAWRRKIYAQLPEHEHMRVLDVGCGPAFFTMILAQDGHDVTGIDFSDGMLERARKNARAYGVSAEIRKMDSEHPDYPEDTFDLVLCRNVTHTLQNHPATYAQWKRILKPGGVLLIFDANWHLVWFRGPVRDQYLSDVRECIRRFGSDFSERTDPDIDPDTYDMPETPHRLGDLQRPDWDLGILSAIGFSELSYERDITKELWDEKERLLYRTTPMFMIRARK